jgi:hypothetical protein
MRPRLKAVPSASRSPGLHRPNSRQRPPRRSNSQRKRSAPMHFICSSRNPSELGRGLVFLCRSNRAITCRFSLVHLQLFNDRASAHSREGSRALRFTLCRSSVNSMRGAAVCTAVHCAVLQPGNGEAEAPGVGRWVLRSHNDTMAFSLSKTPLPMILGPSWNSLL